MAPVPLVGPSSSLQVIIGCVAPFFLVTSFIPIVVYRRHLQTRAVNLAQEAQSRATVHPTPRTIPTPRLPLTSVYVARVDYYLPALDTGSCTMASLSIAGSEANHSNVSLRSAPSLPPLPTRIHATPAQIPKPELPHVLPENALASLPSLPSMLNEFTAYADVIEPKFLSETKQSSSCLLDSAFSSMDVQALSFPSISGLRAQLPPSSGTLSVSIPSKRCVSRLEIRNYIEEVFESDSELSSPEASVNQCPFNANSVSSSPGLTSFADRLEVSLVAPTELPIDEKDLSVDMNIKGLCSHENGVKIGNATSNSPLPYLVPSLSKLSLVVDSSSTIGSVLAVRLSDFPAVPAFPPKILSKGQNLVLVTRQSISSITSTISRSLSAPASLNILEIRVEDFFRTSHPCDRLLRTRISDHFSLTEPGELWDEDDDKLFAVRQLPPPDLTSRPYGLSRHTWTAGVVYNREDKGDLWDDEDERRYSTVIPVKFKGLGLLPFEMESSTDGILSNNIGSMNGGLPSLSSDSGTTLEDQSQTLQPEKKTNVGDEQQEKINCITPEVNWTDGERVKGLDFAENIGVPSIQNKDPEECEVDLAFYYKVSAKSVGTR